MSQRSSNNTSSNMTSNSEPKNALGNMLASNSSPSRKHMGASATVGGDQNVKSIEKGEIYIRPDGKKVRKVKKTIVRQKSGRSMASSSTDGNSSTDGSGSPGKKKGEIYINAQGKKVRRVIRRTKSGVDGASLAAAKPTPAVADNTPTTTTTRPSVTATPSSDTLGEIFVRADGKKVRRVPKKTKSSASLPATALSNTTNTATTTTAATKSGLGSFLNQPNSTTATEASAATPSKAAPSVNGGEGEVYINAQGKKVRRIRRTRSSTNGGTGSVTGGAGGGSVAGSTATTPALGEIYINAAGKRVRRVKKPTNANASGNASVTGSVTSTVIGEGDVYIRADGKKVRRVKRNPSSSSINSASSSNSGGGEPVGDVYINAQGKKVRRIRKTRSIGGPNTGASTNNTNANTNTASASATHFGATQSILQERAAAKAKADAAATATTSSSSNDAAARPASPNKSDSHVSTASSTGSGAAAPAALGEIYINAAGKKVRRVRRSASSQSMDSAASSVSGTGGGQGQQRAPLRRTLSGESAASAASGGKASSVPQEGEIYVRADGKRVRRVRRTTSERSTATNGGGPPVDGEIVIRPDGKKVIRRVRSKLGAGLTGDAANSKGTANAAGSGVGEVYRRADGKLVRRVKRNTSAASLPTVSTSNRSSGAAASKLSGVPETATSDTPSGPSRRASLSVGYTPPASNIVLTAEEDATADGYRKMLKMGLPEGAVRHKMTTGDVSGKVIASVFGEEWKDDADAKPAAVETAAAVAKQSHNIVLTDEEEGLADTYRKMTRMGLPQGAVRHKMETSQVHPKIIAAVFGEEWTDTDAPEKTPIVLTNEEEELADTYRKMKRMGLPEGAVRQKMATSQVHPKVVAAVFGEEWTEPDAPAPAPVSTAPGTEDKSTVSLTEEEEDVADTYRKMQRMGMPEGAVRQKMETSQVHPKIIAAVFGESWVDDAAMTQPPAAVTTPESSSTLTDEEEAIASKYRKMQSMGLPDDAVRHKMVMSEEDPKIIAALFGGQSNEKTQTQTPPSSLSVEEETIAASYRKMKAMGLPDDAVRHKMIVNDVDPKIISAVIDGDAPPPTESETSAPNAIAYVVMVGDDTLGDATAQQASDDNSVSSLDPNEKFAVKVSDTTNPASPTKKTKFFTLTELAKMSGQEKSELEAIVSNKRKNGETTPRFSLLPLDEQKYEVSMPKANSGNTPQGGTPTSANATNVKEGEEVVDSELAKAARAVTALGDGDMSALLDKLKSGDMKDLLAKLQEAEKRQKKLEKQLAQAGVAIAEDIEYQEAKSKVEEIAKRMNEIGGSDVIVSDKAEQNRLREEYFKLEQQMERYNTALMMTEEFQAEQDRLELKWERDNEPANIEALRKLRRHMPVNIRNLSEAELTTKPSPNGKFLPKAIAKKFKRTNILQCLRLNPDDIECMHPATLENMRVTGLTLTERRALYVHFKPIGPKWEKNKAEKMTERKWTWYKMMKNNFKENLAPYLRHVEQYGPPENHPYATRDSKVGCPLLGKQCPIKADKLIDYDGDYGWTPESEFEVSEVRKHDVEDSGAKAMAEAAELAKEKKANERADLLKKHYKGKLLQVSKANGSCEGMDETMDLMEFATLRWIEFIIDKGENESEDDKKKEIANFTDTLNELKLKVIDFCQRSGMQMSGKKKAGGDKTDIRSSVEASLSEELFECSRNFFSFIKDRMTKLAIYDTRATKTIEMLDAMLMELHSKNVELFSKLGAKRMNRSRKLKTNKDMQKEAEDQRKPKDEEAPDVDAGSSPSRGPPPGAGGRGGLLDAIAGGRGRGGRGGGGRGGLMDAIAGRGKKPAGGGGGRGGLLDAIAGRGKKPAGGGGGGRGGLLDAIAAKGRGGGRGPPGGGRGGLMAAIAARGGGGS